MAMNVGKMVSELRRMTVTELRRRHAKVFGEPTPEERHRRCDGMPRHLHELIDTLHQIGCQSSSRVLWLGPRAPSLIARCLRSVWRLNRINGGAQTHCITLTPPSERRRTRT